MHSLDQNLLSVQTRITTACSSANRSADAVRLIAVSKKHSSDSIRHIYQLGHRDFAENYLQESLDKIQALGDLAIQWHFIGTIQSNKTAAIAQHFQWVQSIDREKIAQRLNDQRPADTPALNVCIQINLDAEQTKSGLTPTQAQALAKRISCMPRLRLRGLMFIPAAQPTLEARRQSCQRAALYFQQLQRCFPSIDTLSLGMSADLEPAIESGSTMVRIGTDIFGPRI